MFLFFVCFYALSSFYYLICLFLYHSTTVLITAVINSWYMKRQVSSLCSISWLIAYSLFFAHPYTFSNELIKLYIRTGLLKFLLELLESVITTLRLLINEHDIYFHHLVLFQYFQYVLLFYPLRACIASL